MNYPNKVTTIAMTCLIGTFVLYGSAYAKADSDELNAKTHNSKIVGIWDADVVVASCSDPEDIKATFSAMHKYEAGGTGQVVPDSGATGLSAHMVIWSRVKKDEYDVSMKMYRFGPAGENIGWVIAHNEISMSDDGNEYVGTGKADFYNAAGIMLFSSCPSFVATRFTGE